ncbi:MAG: FtsX-like permease family protein [Proteobacteria bacterium]|nr:MAG: FtsX-like permease family protein [Pseudomonadota bacterium]
MLVTHEDEVAQHARRVVRLRDGLIQSDERRLPPARPKEGAKKSRVAAPDGPETSATLALHVWRTFQSGIKSLQMHPMRSLLTMLGIFIGVASVIWLLAIGEGISAKAQEQIAQLGANNLILSTQRPPPQSAGNSRLVRYGVTEQDYVALRDTVPELKDVVAVRELDRRDFSVAARHSVGRLVGTMPGYANLNRLEVERGRFLADTDLRALAKVCVIAPQVVAELFAYEDPIGRVIHVGSDYYRVVGVLKERAAGVAIQGVKAAQDFSRDVYIPLTTLQATIHDPYGRTDSGVPILTQVTLSLGDTKQVLDAAEVVRRTLQYFHSQEDYTLTVPLELLQQARNTRLLFIAMMGMIAAISLLVGGIGIMNIMLATVTERTREIGIRRAIGARRRDIIRQFLVETVVLSTAGGLAGVVGGLACGPVFRGLLAFLAAAFPAAMTSLPESIRGMTPILVTWWPCGRNALGTPAW